MKNLFSRSLTGLAFIAVILTCVMWNAYSFLILFSIVALLCQFEFYRMLRKGEVVVFPLAGILFGLLILTLNYLFLCRLLDLKYLSLLLLIIPGVMISGLYTNQKDPVRAISWTLLGLFYVIIPFCLFMHIAFLPDFEYQSMRILGILLILWATDTMAYLVGMAFGKSKMFSRISPKKTWEGAIGGAIGGLGVSVLVWNFLNPQSSLATWLIIAALIIVFGIF